MSKVTTTRSRRIPPDQLPEAIFDLLAAQPQTSDKLAYALGYSANVIRERLTSLRMDGFVVRESKELVSGRHYIWRVNSSASGLPFPRREEKSRAGGIREPYQKTLHTYPVVGRRDPLAAALFGPARKEAA